MEKIRFDKTARTEHYFTATILPILLSANNYQVVRNLFASVYNNCEFKDEHDIEIVTELDPIRDPSVINNEIKKIYIKEKRIAVPDLFLRLGNKILIIEGKFFTFPDSEQMMDQIKKQKSAIDIVKKYTIYEMKEIKYCALTVETQDYTDEIIGITWSELIKILNTDNNLLEYKYYFDILTEAIDRASKENKNEKSDYHWEKVSFNELVENISKYIKDGKVFVGFSEGVEALNKMSLEDLKNRDHYKLAKTKISNNWITIDKIIGKYIELKYCKLIEED